MQEPINLMRVTAAQIVLDMYKRTKPEHKTAEEFVHDVNLVYDYIIQDLPEKKKDVTTPSQLRPV